MAGDFVSLKPRLENSGKRAQRRGTVGSTNAMARLNRRSNHFPLTPGHAQAGNRVEKQAIVNKKRTSQEGDILSNRFQGK